MIDSIYLQRLLSTYRGLEISEIGDRYISLRGTLKLNHSYDLIPFSKEFAVEIVVPRNYPQELPMIKDIGNSLNPEYEHINYDRTLCLAVEVEIRKRLAPNYDLIQWVEDFVFPYLYSYCYYENYGAYPFGDRSHGAKGILEYYTELFQVEGTEEGKFLLLAARNYNPEKIYKGHRLCPCGSNKRVRECHGVENLKKLSLYINQQMIRDLRLIEWEENFYED